MERQELIDLFCKAWEDMQIEDKIEVSNIYSRENNIDNEVFVNDEEFFETFFNGKTMDAIRATQYGNYSISDEYVWFNGYANLDSDDGYGYHNELPFECTNTMAEWFIDNYEELSCISDMDEFYYACQESEEEDEEEE